MLEELGDIRREYNIKSIDEKILPDNPFNLFEEWLNIALKTLQFEPNYMLLSTHGTNGFPQTRVVLLKDYSKEGLIFYTNYKSQKGVAIAIDNRVCLTFYWPELGRQIRIEGIAIKSSEEDSKKYFDSRPLESRISANISPQSRKIASRDLLVEAYNKMLKNSENIKIEKPKDWGGYLVKPTSYEFWQGGNFRLHDRILYSLNKEKWEKTRLAP